MSKKGKFILGAGLGLGLGLLFAPKKGEETRKELAEKLSELFEKAKAIDIEEVKEDLTDKIVELQTKLKELDKEKAKEEIIAKATEIKNKSEEVIKLAVEKGTPAVKKAAKDVKSATAKTLKKISEDLEK